MQPQLSLPIEGRTNWKWFWSIFGAAMFSVGILVSLIFNGAVALAAVDLPGSFTISAGSIDGNSFQLGPGQTSNGAPTAVVNMDGTMSGLTITKSITLAGHTINFSISAGKGSTPVSATDMTIDAPSIGADSAGFSNLSMDASGGGGAGSLSADHMTLSNAQLSVPYLNAGTITLPGMSLSVSLGG